MSGPASGTLTQLNYTQVSIMRVTEPNPELTQQNTLNPYHERNSADSYNSGLATPSQVSPLGRNVDAHEPRSAPKCLFHHEPLRVYLPSPFTVATTPYWLSSCSLSARS